MPPRKQAQSNAHGKQRTDSGTGAPESGGSRESAGRDPPKRASGPSDVPSLPAVRAAYPVALCLKTCGRVLLRIAIIILILFCIVFPILVKIFPSLPKEIVYLNAVRIPWHVTLSDPQTAGMNATRNFHLTTEPGIVIGVWHALPEEIALKQPSEASYEGLLASGHPIILYCHGNTGTRASHHRVQLYKILSAQGYHVITYDYRGFGDSTGSPTSEVGVVHDAKFMYRWVKQRSSNSPLYVWGHSLGTGIATKAVKELLAEGVHMHALVLESPFNNVADAALHHPFALPFRMLWWFDDVFIEGIHANGIYLQSDENILSVSVPILIMHAEDDYVVPYHLGVKLYEASNKRPSHFGPVTFRSFDASRGYEHKWICHAPELPELLRTFFSSAS